MSPFPNDGNGPYRLLRAFSGRAVETFLRSQKDPRAEQERRFTLIRNGLRGTVFANDHQISDADDLSAWRQKVPIRRHGELLSYLDRVANAEPRVLTRAPVRSLLETSGTTGRPKWLPVTDTWAQSVADAQALWVLSLIRDDEGITKGPAFSIVSKAESARSPGGLVVGSNTGRMFLAQPWWVRWRAAVPYTVYTIDDPELRAYCILRHALVQPIVSWTTANPSTILLYCRHMARWWEDLSADCRDGTLSHGPAANLEKSTRRALQSGAKKGALPNEPLPARVWNLRRINCWTGGAAAFFLARLPQALGAEVPVREVGITASEGFFAIPVDDQDSVLWAGGHVLEFVDEAGAVHWAWELKEGEVYRLVVSTEAGLYRYDLEDLVQVTGWLGPLPRLRFLRKAGRMLNSMGEKVTEDQVAEAGAGAFAGAIGISVTLRMAEVPNLAVAVEGAGDVREFDALLQRLNIEYESRRSGGRIGPPTLHVVPPGTFAAWRARKVAAGAPEAQVKDPLVLPEAEWKQLIGIPEG